MEYSLASYLIPIFLEKKINAVRVHYDGKHILDVNRSSGHSWEPNITIKHRNLMLRQDTKTNKCEPFFSAFKQVIRDHLSADLNVNTVDMTKFEAYTLLTEMDRWGTVIATSQGECLEIPWGKPWLCESQVENLTALCRGNKVNLALTIQKLKPNFTAISSLSKKTYRNSLSISFQGQKFVILKNGAIFDYVQYKVIAENLDTFMRSGLGLAADAEITWEQYCQHLYIRGLPLKMWLKYTSLKEQDMNLAYAHQYWQKVKGGIAASMPLLQADPYMKPRIYRQSTMELLAFNPGENHLETYTLGYHGIQRTFNKEPRPGYEEEEALEAYQAWHRNMNVEQFQELLHRPGITWFARLRTKYASSSCEAVKIVLP